MYLIFLFILIRCRKRGNLLALRCNELDCAASAKTVAVRAPELDYNSVTARREVFIHARLFIEVIDHDIKVTVTIKIGEGCPVAHPKMIEFP